MSFRARLRRLERVQPPICPVCRIDHTRPPRITPESFRPRERGERVDPDPCPACHRPRVYTIDLNPDPDR